MNISLLVSMPITVLLLKFFYTDSQGFSSCLIIILHHRSCRESIQDSLWCILLYFWLSIPFVLHFFSLVPLSLTLPPLLRWVAQHSKENQPLYQSWDKYKNYRATQQKERLILMAPPCSFFSHSHSNSLSIAFLLTVLSNHNWKFPLLSPVWVRDNAASMFCGAWSKEMEHCLM